MFENLVKAGKYLGQAARMMVGVPDYDSYVQHFRLTHPEETPMSYEEFYVNRLEARYGGSNGMSSCC